MEDVSISLLLGILCFLIICSAFFSSSETGMMSLNRYRLRNLVKQNHRAAQKVDQLLKHPDRLIGVILIGNNFVNIFASSIATVIAIRLWGDAGIAIATATLTIIILIFAEVTPKTLAALHPEKIAFPASYILGPLLKLLYPLVYIVNQITNGLLKIFGISSTRSNDQNLSTEELRTIVNEAGSMLPKGKQSMLLGVLELNEVTVEDIMIPRNEILGIDLDLDFDQILETITSSEHTLLPVYNTDINKAIGILHLRNLTKLIQQNTLTKTTLVQVIREPYFIPESTPLQVQLFNFQKENHRLGLVVDEYGDVQGIATLSDILEEIVGELSSVQKEQSNEIHPQEDNSYIIEGTAFIRDINKALNWTLPTNGPKTLNGLITETLEAIPDANVCLKVNNYHIETLQIADNQIKSSRLFLINHSAEDGHTDQH
ncbi:MAG: HlyC/CorC family transporter [Oceanospirillaceae bacterium]|nr:HlyC/CorC family transporter [Oceanospirillaceae bacterium]